jgi:hypothetical protein
VAKLSPEDRDRLALLRQRRAELLQLRKNLKGMVGDLDVLIGEEERRRVQGASTVSEAAAAISSEAVTPATVLSADALAGANAPPARRHGRPLRAVVLDALEDIGWPTYSRELSLFCSAWFGRAIQPERFGSLANDEVKAFQRALEGSSVRPVWLCFALTHDRHQPIKRLWGRSDWPLEWRIIAPTSGRIQYLKLTARLCELAKREGAANPEMMHIIAADHARDLPGVRVQRGRFELGTWRDIALKQLRELEPRDAEIRAKSAARLRDRGPFTQLFGVPEVEEVDEAVPKDQRRRG